MVAAGLHRARRRQRRGHPAAAVLPPGPGRRPGRCHRTARPGDSVPSAPRRPPRKACARTHEIREDCGATSCCSSLDADGRGRVLSGSGPRGRGPRPGGRSRAGHRPTWSRSARSTAHSRWRLRVVSDGGQRPVRWCSQSPSRTPTPPSSDSPGSLWRISAIVLAAHRRRVPGSIAGLGLRPLTRIEETAETDRRRRPDRASADLPRADRGGTARSSTQRDARPDRACLRARAPSPRRTLRRFVSDASHELRTPARNRPRPRRDVAQRHRATGRGPRHAGGPDRVGVGAHGGAGR